MGVRGSVVRHGGGDVRLSEEIHPRKLLGERNNPQTLDTVKKPLKKDNLVAGLDQSLKLHHLQDVAIYSLL